MFAAILSLLCAFPTQDQSRDQIIEADIKSAVDKLGSDNYWDAAMARAELMNFGRRVVPALIEAYNKNRGAALDEDDKSIRVRYFVCEILGEARADSPEAVDLLISALKDRGRFGTTLVSTSAAGSLGKLGSERSIQPLLDEMAGKAAERDKIYLGEVITALGNLRALQAGASLLKLLDRTDLTADDEPEKQRARAIACIAAEALGKIRHKDAVTPLIRKVDAEVRDPLTDEPMETFVVAALRRILPDQAAKTDEEIRTWAKDERDKIEKAEREKAAAEARAKTLDRMKTIQDAVAKHKTQKGSFPARLADLRPDLLESDDALKDGWGKDFSYKTPGTGGAEYDVVSFAADGKEWGAGIDEDVWNHKLWEPGLVQKAKDLLKKVAAAIDQFKADQGKAPMALIDLFRRPPGASKWPKDGYLPDLAIDVRDPFGRALHFEPKADGPNPYTLKSLGLDHKEGGEGIYADISAWDSK